MKIIGFGTNHFCVFGCLSISPTKHTTHGTTTHVSLPWSSLTRVMRSAVSIPAVASVYVLHSAAVGGSVVGVVGPL